MGNRYYYNSKGTYAGKSSGLSPAQMGGQGLALVIIASLFALQWVSHNFWLLTGICSLILAAYMFLTHAFQNFRRASFGLLIILIALVGSAYFEIAQLHYNKVGYAAAQKLLKRVTGIS